MTARPSYGVMFCVIGIVVGALGMIFVYNYWNTGSELGFNCNGTEDQLRRENDLEFDDYCSGLEADRAKDFKMLSALCFSGIAFFVVGVSFMVMRLKSQSWKVCPFCGGYVEGQICPRCRKAI